MTLFIILSGEKKVASVPAVMQVESSGPLPGGRVNSSVPESQRCPRTTIKSIFRVRWYPSTAVSVCPSSHPAIPVSVHPFIHPFIHPANIY